MNIPKQYLPVMPYIITGESEAFLAFTKQVFNATEQLIVPGNDGRAIMHGEIRIFDAVIMFAQRPEGFTDRAAGMFIYVENVDLIYGLALKNNAKTLQTPVKQDYGYTAGFEDPFGNQWWIVQPESE